MRMALQPLNHLLVPRHVGTTYSKSKGHGVGSKCQMMSDGWGRTMQPYDQEQEQGVEVEVPTFPAVTRTNRHNDSLILKKTFANKIHSKPSFKYVGLKSSIGGGFQNILEPTASAPEKESDAPSP